jgi:beta-N-acetylhexosaminidase
MEIPFKASSGDIRAVLTETATSRIVIVGTISADQDQPQADLVEALHDRGKTLIVVAMRTPYDLRAFPMIDTYLCAYGIRPVTTEAVARVLFGEISAVGTLPCTIPDV